MLIDRTLADRFIATYMDFLGTLVSADEKSSKRPTQWLVVGRQRYQAERGALQVYRAEHPQADAEMLDAIAALQFERWVYLKDTRSYSVFLPEDGRSALGVLGLTNRLRDITADSGLIVHTGVMPINGRWVCDGLLENAVIIGSNMRRNLTEEYQALRRDGKFSLGPVGADGQ
jgi:hypothetical protein